MNGFVNTFGLVTGVVVAVLSGVFAFFNRDRYKTLINDIYEPGNKELREQLADARQVMVQVSQERAQLQTQVIEKDNLIKELKDVKNYLPDLTQLTKQSTELTALMANNHKEIMGKMTELAKAIVKS